MAQLIRRVTLKNFKSIADCNVQLRDLTIIVGPNGAGKSNFIDSLRFVNDALTHNVDYALRQRGGINEVRRRSGGHPNNFSIKLQINVKNEFEAHYAFRVTAKADSGFSINIPIRFAQVSDSAHKYGCI